MVGPGASTTASARTNLGAAARGANADITSLSGITGNIVLPESTASAGNILKAGVPFIHDFGNGNTFVGKNAGNLTTLTGGSDTAVGQAALNANTEGSDNTALGTSALSSNTTGGANTAVGSFALYNNQTYDVTKCTAPGRSQRVLYGRRNGDLRGRLEHRRGHQRAP